MYMQYAIRKCKSFRQLAIPDSGDFPRSEKHEGVPGGEGCIV